jgi:hypothetical protein
MHWWCAQVKQIGPLIVLLLVAVNFLSLQLTNGSFGSPKIPMQNPDCEFKRGARSHEPKKEEGEPRPGLFLEQLLGVKRNTCAGESVKDTVASLSIVSFPGEVRGDPRGFLL